MHQLRSFSAEGSGLPLYDEEFIVAVLQHLPHSLKCLTMSALSYQAQTSVRLAAFPKLVALKMHAHKPKFDRLDMMAEGDCVMIGPVQSVHAFGGLQAMRFLNLGSCSFPSQTIFVLFTGLCASSDSSMVGTRSCETEGPCVAEGLVEHDLWNNNFPRRSG